MYPPTENTRPLQPKQFCFMRSPFYLLLTLLTLAACQSKEPVYDTIIRNGMIYDGSGSSPFHGDIAIQADTIVQIGALGSASAKNEVDAGGLAVAPGFINMMGHSEESLIIDGRSQSDLKQGVTTEIFGELSFGPLNDGMKERMKKSQVDISYEVGWNTLGEYMQFVENKGIACNIASFVGTGAVRQYVIGEGNVAPTRPSSTA